MSLKIGVSVIVKLPGRMYREATVSGVRTTQRVWGVSLLSDCVEKNAGNKVEYQVLWKEAVKPAPIQEDIWFDSENVTVQP